MRSAKDCLKQKATVQQVSHRLSKADGNSSSGQPKTVQSGRQQFIRSAKDFLRQRATVHQVSQRLSKAEGNSSSDQPKTV